MNTPSELFNFYETYLNIYEAPFEITGPHSYKTGDGRPEQDSTIKNTPRVVSSYQGDDAATRKKARNKADKLNQEYGASVYKVNRTDEPRKRGTAVEDSVEYVLDYLIDEGFTDSYEGADAILESMSDEWLEGIIDERTRYAKETGRSATQRAVYQGRENRSLKGGYLAPEVNKTPEDEKHNRLMVAVRKYGSSIPKVKQTKKERGGPTPTPPYHLTPKEKVSRKREKPPVDYYSSRND